jgi:uncharacterized protein
MQRPPQNMQKLTQAFADGVRHTSIEQARSITRYHEFVRDNVRSVITHTFPMFSQQLSEQTIEYWVNTFLLHSQAIEPEFHHIATEFVRFLQTHSNALPAKVVSVLEYEWVLFNAEINPETVTLSVKHQPETVTFESLYRCTLQLNPTLQLIEVPFHVNKNAIQFINENEPSQAYAVYRNTAHQVLSQPLGMHDRIVLAPLYQQGAITFETLAGAVSECLSDHEVSTWVQHFSQTNLIWIDNVSNVNSDSATANQYLSGDLL